MSRDGKSLIITNKRLLTNRKYIGTTDPEQIKFTTKEYFDGRHVVQERKRRHRLESLNTIFEEAKLKWDQKDPRIDDVSDISSSDEPIYNPDYQADYVYS